VPQSRRARRNRFARGVLLACVLVVASGCYEQPEPTIPSAPSMGAAPIVFTYPAIDQPVLDRRGEIVSQLPFVNLEPTLADQVGDAVRATYASTSAIRGATTNVTGSFFIPRGSPPEGGWPVVSWAHGTTGISHGCAPSEMADLRGDASIVAALLSQGYAVAMTDYEGLSGEGVHDYLEPRASAYNVIDAVRALRHVFPAASPKWIAIGSSQGGQAAWAADEVNSTYGVGLQMVGAIALSPVTNIYGFADEAMAGTLSDAQRAVYPLIVLGLARYDSTIDPEHYLRDDAKEAGERLSNCQLNSGQSARPKVDSKDLRPDSVQAAETLKDALRRIALPQAPLSVPMLVINGQQDDFVPPGWVSAAILRSCQLGGHIEHVEMKGATHSNLGDLASTIGDWVHGRLTDQEAPVNCPAGS